MSKIQEFKMEISAFQAQVKPHPSAPAKFEVSDYLKWLEVKALERIADTLDKIEAKLDN